MIEQRRLGQTDLWVSPVAMGCWPISGMTSLGVDEDSSIRTLQCAFANGVNFFDTAFAYGANGESDRLIAKALGNRRDQIVLASKGGIHWKTEGKQGRDGKPVTLARQCETSLARLETDHVDLFYLHAPDPHTPIAESAVAIQRLLDEGKILSAGISNATLAEIQAFHAECPLTAYQPPYNMLQRGIEESELPWCRENGVSVAVYWPLLKGLLAGKLSRDHVFDERDGRKKYPMFQGEEWEKNQDYLDGLRSLAADWGVSMAALAVAWVIRQPGITSALCGAKRPDQIRETATAMQVELSADDWRRVDDLLLLRGQPHSRSAV